MASYDYQETIATAATVASAANAAQTAYTSASGVPPPPPPPAPNKPTGIIRFDKSYARTFPGILKLAQVVTNIVGMICIMASHCSYCSNSNWFNFVASTGLTVTLLLLVFYFFHIVEKLRFFPWLGIELLYCATWTLFYMIAAMVVAVKGARDDAWAAAGFFGFLGAILYATDCYVKYKAWRDGIPAQGEKPIATISSPITSPTSPNYAAY